MHLFTFNLYAQSDSCPPDYGVEGTLNYQPVESALIGTGFRLFTVKDENGQFTIRMENDGVEYLQIRDWTRNNEEITSGNMENEFIVTPNPINIEVDQQEAIDIMLIAQEANKFFCTERQHEFVIPLTQILINRRPDWDFGGGPKATAGDLLIEFPENDNSWIRPDVIVHELTHLYQNEFYPELSSFDDGRGIGEGIADIVGMVFEQSINTRQNSLGPWFEFGPGPIREIRTKPSIIYGEEDFMGLPVWQQGLILGHWFYLLVCSYPQN